MKITKLICNNCGVEFEKPTKEITRQIKNGRKEFYCSLSCSAKKLKTTTEKIMVKCLWCEKEFETTTHKKARKCCSKTCFGKYVQSKVNPETHKKSVYREKNFPKEKQFQCIICNNKFKFLVKNDVFVKKTCSKECDSKLKSKIARENPNCGGKLGYRRFKYKTFSMDSRWEVELAKWMDENNIEWDRSKSKYMFWWIDVEGNKHKYFPDFYLPKFDVYLDPKNDFYLQRDLPKLKFVIKNYNIKLFYGKVEPIKQELTKLLTY